MKKYARKSDFNGKGINQGYIFNDGQYYCQTEKQAKEYVESKGFNWKEEKQKFNTKNEWFYFTLWEEIDTEELFDIEGNVYTTCVECNEPVNLELKKCESCFTSIYIITLSPSKT
ncbi:MAG: hypothetical protein CMO82_02860 [Winogradskyella sp.]|nr:hypothetical protein [Winogradskyella sp.]|tara:strand:- start:152 stop:496 length:345 start_codon:yes stop_codon:yes gene_type:complete